MSTASLVPNIAAIDGFASTPKLVLKAIEPSTIWIRSELPVRYLRERTSLYVKPLGEALAHGIVAKRDPSRHDFFEAVFGDTWIYCHIADRLRSIYIVAIANVIT